MRGITRDIYKSCFHFRNSTKIVTWLGNFKKLKCKERVPKNVYKHIYLNIFFVKFIGREFPKTNEITEIFLQVLFLFLILHKMETNLGQFTGLGPFFTYQHCKLCQLCYHFSLKFESEENKSFFKYP